MSKHTARKVTEKRISYILHSFTNGNFGSVFTNEGCPWCAAIEAAAQVAEPYLCEGAKSRAIVAIRKLADQEEQ